jgi:hypothetical protein
MGWTTLYITGKEDFREEIKDRLEGSNLDIMSGYTGTYTPGGEAHELYWIDEKTDLRNVKEAIGSKLIWKYRLNFYPSFEAFIETQNRKQKRSHQLTEEDFALFEQYKASVR